MFTYPIGFMQKKAGGTPVPSDYISAWFFNGNANDDTGTHNGTLINSPTLITGFDGSANSAYNYTKIAAQSMNAGRVNELEGIAKFTISTWWRKAAGKELFLGKFASAGSGLLLQWFSDNIIYASVRNAGTPNSVTYDATALLGTWVNPVMVFDGTLSTVADRVKLFLNGVRVGVAGAGTFPVLTDNSTNDFQWNKYLTINTDGDYDNTRIYLRVLTQEEITAIANQ